MKQQLSTSNIEKQTINSIKLDKKILVGTHHKAGTVWLQSIFKRICNDFSLVFFNGRQSNLPEQFDVFLHFHSQFDLTSLHFDFRGLHIIRDPRDIIISGCFYHQVSSEKWLHKPLKQYGGKTYQEKINSYSTLDDKILFEMENSGYRNINKILNWDYTNQNFLEIKYEELIVDSELKLFSKIFTFLGFPINIMPNLLNISYNKSMFSGKIKQTEHIRSGKSKQWKEHFKPIHKSKFNALFDNALTRLGYEPNNEW
jgi:hypothetical protein